MNQDAREAAQAALHAFRVARTHHSSPEEDIADLIADLAHLTDDGEAVLATATRNYRAEESGE